MSGGFANRQKVDGKSGYRLSRFLVKRIRSFIETNDGRKANVSKCFVHFSDGKNGIEFALFCIMGHKEEKSALIASATLEGLYA